MNEKKPIDFTAGKAGYLADPQPFKDRVTADLLAAERRRPDHFPSRVVCTLPEPVRDTATPATLANCTICNTEFILLNGFIEVDSNPSDLGERWVVRKTWDDYMARRFQYDERTGMYWEHRMSEPLPEYMPPFTGDHLLNMSAEDRAALADAKLENPGNTPDETS